MKMVMPKMGMTMEEGTIVEWKKKDGDYVEKGEIILEIMTNKINIDVEAPDSGYLQILKHTDESVPVDEPIAIIEKSPEEKLKELMEIPTIPGEKKEVEYPVGGIPTEPVPAPSGRGMKKIPVSPRAKILAEERNVPLDTIQGTGPNGAITEKDVLIALGKGRKVKAKIEEKEEMGARQIMPEKGITFEPETPPGREVTNVSPLAERIAADRGVDLSLVEGTGIGGKITKEDVFQYLEIHKPAPAGIEKQKPPEVKFEEYKEEYEEIEEKVVKEEIPEEVPEEEIVEEEQAPEEEILEIEEEITEREEEVVRGVPSPGEELPEPAFPAKIQPLEIPGGSIPLKGIRKLTAERMLRSKKEAPHLTLGMEADMTEATKLKNSLSVTYTDILVKATALALKAHPIMNSTLSGDTIIMRDEVNIGIAVAREDDLLVPVIHHADTVSVKEISRITKDLITRTKNDQLTDKDVLDGTFTISNLGMYSIDFFTPIINPPEAAILGVGAVSKKPVVMHDTIEIRERITLSLSFDHRIVNGMPAALFLKEIKTLLEHPYRLLVEEGS
jgi:pyruvate dehydrogenase E2 component (dihydrolipoamide acetyltransferase)